MKHFRYFWIAFALVAAAFPANALEAGAAKVDITPPLDTPLNGYFDRMGRGAVSVHDPVTARCVYLDDGKTQVFLLSADLCVMNRELVQRTLDLAPPEVPKENIFLSATHNHSGPGGMVRPIIFRSISGRFMPEVLEATAQKFAASMRSAYSARQRAALGWGTFQQNDLSKNRRVAGGPMDTQVGVIRVENADGTPLAVIANLAAHPTNSPMEDGLAVSSDYCGYFYDELEQREGEGCVAVFLNGAEGNQSCAGPPGLEGWEKAEAVGRALGQRTNELASGLKCGDAVFRVAVSNPLLPRSLATPFLPSETTLKTLEINDLLLAFVPGEPCVEIGLEMRRRALARGYAGQFTIGLSNDHLMYFVPRAMYPQPVYESGMNYYGPGIEDFLYREFSKLLSRGQPEPELPKPAAPSVESQGIGKRVALSGTPYELGYARGAAFGAVLHEAYQQRVVARVDDKTWVPKKGGWLLAPSFINQTPLALPRLGLGARPLLRGLSAETMLELEGLADGAELPFDATWLVQCEPIYSGQDEIDAFYRSPFCTMVAAIGKRAGNAGVIVGRTFDWSSPDAPVAAVVTPAKGHAFVSVGFPWTIGAFSGMNDAGLVLCAERMEPLGKPRFDTPPIEIVLRQILEKASTLREAQEQLAAFPLRGYHVLIADPAYPDARVIELGDAQTPRYQIDGLILGADPVGALVDEHSKARYARTAELLKDARTISVSTLQSLFQDSDANQPDDAARICNTQTRYAVIFEPKYLRYHIAFQDDAGALGVFQRGALERGTP